MYVSEAVKSRFSCRAFTEKPVSKELIKEILDVAKQAPSGATFSHGIFMQYQEET